MIAQLAYGVIGSLFFLFIPGYLLSMLFFKHLSAVERVAFSIGFSLVVNLFIGLLLAFAGAFSVATLWVSIIVVCVIVVVVLVYRPSKQSPSAWQ